MTIKGYLATLVFAAFVVPAAAAAETYQAALELESGGIPATHAALKFDVGPINVEGKSRVGAPIILEGKSANDPKASYRIGLIVMPTEDGNTVVAADMDVVTELAAPLKGVVPSSSKYTCHQSSTSRLKDGESATVADVHMLLLPSGQLLPGCSLRLKVTQVKA